jgi:CRP-like cAMP-binding protein
MIKSRFLSSLKNQGRIVFKSRFLNYLSYAEAYEFVQLCHKRSFKTGEFIYHQGDPGNGMYIIEEGQVELLIENSIKKEDDTEQPVSLILEAPEVFGNLSIDYDMRRMSSARAVTDAKVLGFFAPDMEMLQRRQPRIALKFMNEINRTLAKQLGITIKTLANSTSEISAHKLQFETHYTQDNNETS